MKFDMISLIQAVQERRGFMLVQGRLETVMGGYRVTIPQDAQFAVLPEERKAFENPHQSLWRVGAGGGLVVLHCTDASIALMRYRDKGAPSYGDHWTLGSGLTSSVNEIVHPLHGVVRETVEEFGIVTPGGIVMPTFGDDELDSLVRGAVRSSKFMHEQAELSEFDTNTYQVVQAAFEAVPDEETLTVAFEGAGDTSATGVVLIDPNTRGIDLLKVIGVTLPYRLEEVVVVDGEEDRHGHALNAPVGGMDVSKIAQGRQFDVVFQSGMRQDPTGFTLKNMTPVLKEVVSRLAHQ